MIYFVPETKHGRVKNDPFIRLCPIRPLRHFILRDARPWRRGWPNQRQEPRADQHPPWQAILGRLPHKNEEDDAHVG